MIFVVACRCLATNNNSTVCSRDTVECGVMLSESVLGFVFSLFQSISGIESQVYTMLWYLYAQPLESSAGMYSSIQTQWTEPLPMYSAIQGS